MEVGKTKDFTKLLSNKKIMGACASSVFLFTEITPKTIKQESRKKKIKLRC